MNSPLPTQRDRLAELACKIIGPDVVDLVNKGKGWPAEVNVVTSGGVVPVALHIGPITTHGCKGDPAPHERRFQNLPNQSLPVSSPGGALPLLVGISPVPPHVMVVVDGRSRLGNAKRFSLLFHVRLLDEANVSGWGEYISSTGERFLGLRPQMFPIAVEMMASGLDMSYSVLSGLTLASGFLDAPSLVAAERIRKAAFVLIRDAKFSLKVRSAYEDACAMCGLGINLVEGAHIVPVNAPGSTDAISNGIALCRNHHRAFDMYRLHINPQTYEIKQHPIIIAAAAVDSSASNFSSGTRAVLRLPSTISSWPHPDMVSARNHLFKEEYQWA